MSGGQAYSGIASDPVNTAGYGWFYNKFIPVQTYFSRSPLFLFSSRMGVTVRRRERVTGHGCRVQTGCKTNIDGYPRTRLVLWSTRVLVMNVFILI